MARPDSKTRTSGSAAARPPLEPAEPLSGRAALLQVILLLGIPLGLLLAGKVVLNQFFPGLGY